MLELSIPHAGEESRNAKDLVFTVLSRQQPLATIEIFNIIKRQHNVSLTYQAIKKAIDDLVTKKVLEKERKRYAISKQWLLQLKQTIDGLLTTHEATIPFQSFTEAMGREQYAVYTFSTLMDLDSFINQMLEHVATKLEKDEPMVLLGLITFPWWLFINLGSEAKIFSILAKKRIKSYNTFQRNIPLNIWARKQYEILGVKTKVMNEKSDETSSMLVLGNTLMQIVYPKHIADKLKKFYTTYKTPESMSIKELTLIAHTQGDIKFIVFKNRELTQSLYHKYLKNG